MLPMMGAYGPYKLIEISMKPSLHEIFHPRRQVGWSRKASLVISACCYVGKVNERLAKLFILPMVTQKIIIENLRNCLETRKIHFLTLSGIGKNPNIVMAHNIRCSIFLYCKIPNKLKLSSFEVVNWLLTTLVPNVRKQTKPTLNKTVPFMFISYPRPFLYFI